MKYSNKRQIFETGLWLILMVLPLFFGLLWGTQFSEDVYVTLRYANNLASGQGLIYLPVADSVVPPLTAPVFALVLSLAIFLGIDVLLFTAVISLLGWSIAVLSFRFIGKSLNYMPGAFVSAFLLSINPWIITTLGQMTPWIIAIFWLTIAFLFNRRFILAMVAMALGFVLLIPWPPAQTWSNLSEYFWPILWSILLFLAGFGAQWLASILSRRNILHTNGQQTIALLLAFSLIFLGSWQLLRLWQNFQFRPLERWHLEHEIASWLRAETEPKSTVIASEKIGFLAKRRTTPLNSLPEPLQVLVAQSDSTPTHIVSNRQMTWQNITNSPWFHLNYAQANQMMKPTAADAPYIIWQYRNLFKNLEPRKSLNARVPDRMRLLGYQSGPYIAAPGENQNLGLYFQTPEFNAQSFDPFQAIIRLNAYPDNREQATWEIDIPQSGNTNQWQPGQVFTELITLPLPQTLEPGAYKFNISFRGSPSEELWPISFDNDVNRLDRIPLGDIVIPWMGGLSGIQEIDVNYDNKLNLVAYEILNNPVNPTLEVHLYWQPIAHMDQDYTVFVHVIDQAGNLVTNHDGQPADGRFPTSTWREGMIIEDQHRLNMPEGMPGGEYQIMVGIYLQNTGERLAVIDENDSTTGIDVLPLDRFQWPRN